MHVRSGRSIPGCLDTAETLAGVFKPPGKHRRRPQNIYIFFFAPRQKRFFIDFFAKFEDIFLKVDLQLKKGRNGLFLFLNQDGKVT